MKFNRIYILVCLLMAFNALGQTSVVPANPQSKAILLKGGVAHLGNGTVIQNSVIAFDNGKLTVVGDATNTRVDETQYDVRDINGKHVYPGFILPNTDLGLVEVGAIRHMRDNIEQGDIKPNVRTLISYNTDSELIPTLRFNGILLAQVTPAGGIITGTSSIMELDGWNWEDAAHTIDDAMHVNWPGRMRREFDFSTFTVTRVPNDNYDANIDKLEKLFDDAKSYSGLASKEATNLKLEAMLGLFNGSKALHIHTNNAKSIIESVNFAKRHGVQRIVLVGAREAMLVKDFIKGNNIPIVLTDVHRTPSRAGEDVDYPYKLPYLLTQEGIQFCLGYGGTMNSRNLGFFAGTAVAYGMEKEEALKLITSNTAKILGIDSRVGTLEAGKDATFFVSEGDALDMRTNILTHAFISGKEIQLNGMQQQLYEKFKRKYGQE